MMKTYQKYNGKSLRSWIAQASLDLRIRQQTLILAKKKSPQKTADSKQDPEPMEAQEQETTTNRQFRN